MPPQKCRADPCGQPAPFSHEKGYPWIFFYPKTSFIMGFLLTLLLLGIALSFYFWYSRNSDDLAPDSIAGFGFALAGTLCFLLAAICYSLWRRRKRRGIGQLNTALHWHIFFALLGFALILMHSFGNFNAKTGTYALYSMVALLVSGFVGRALDYLIPHLIACEVDAILTAEGDDRIEQMSRNGEFSYPLYLNPSLGKVRNDFQISSQWTDPNAASMPLPVVMARARQQVAAIQRTQRAMQRELCYRYILLYWRLLHLCLAVGTIGLIIWHLIYVAQLMLPEVSH